MLQIKLELWKYRNILYLDYLRLGFQMYSRDRWYLDCKVICICTLGKKGCIYLSGRGIASCNTSCKDPAAAGIWCTRCFRWLRRCYCLWNRKMGSHLYPTLCFPPLPFMRISTLAEIAYTPTPIGRSCSIRLAKMGRLTWSTIEISTLVAPTVASYYILHKA